MLFSFKQLFGPSDLKDYCERLLAGGFFKLLTYMGLFGCGIFKATHLQTKSK